MKNLFIIIIFIFLPITSFANDCTKINYIKDTDNFVKCLNSSKTIKSFVENNESNSLTLEMNSSENISIDFECLNLCKQAIKGSFTLSELNRFCISQCPLKR